MRIHQVCASVQVELNDEKVLFVNPISISVSRHYFWKHLSYTL